MSATDPRLKAPLELIHGLIVEAELRKDLEVTYNGLKRCLKRRSRKKAAPGYQSRRYIRDLMAYVEGCLFVIKRYCLAGHALGKFALTDAELAMCKEVTYGLKNGHAREDDRPKLGFGENTLFVLKLCHQQFNIVPPFDRSQPVWKSLEIVNDRRGKLMHPKSGRCLQVSEEELFHALSLHIWFPKTVKTIFDSIRALVFAPPTPQGIDGEGI